MKVLLVDDDVNVFNLLRPYLRRDEVILHLKEAHGLEKIILEENIKLVLLDINLGEENGLAFFREHRDFFLEHKVAVFFLSQVHDIKSKLEAFEFGAQDYIIKPFEPLEVMARIRSHLGRESQSGPFRKGDLLFDQTSNSVSIVEDTTRTQVELSATEYKLLFFLASREDQIFNRQQLLDHVWAHEKDIIDRTVDQHISKLRKKVKSRIFCIKTNFNLGYSFTKIQK
jgi:two-component system, OmpR family, response regulator